MTTSKNILEVIGLSNQEGRAILDKLNKLRKDSDTTGSLAKKIIENVNDPKSIFIMSFLLGRLQNGNIKNTESEVPHSNEAG